MTSEEKAEQRVSLAYGQLSIGNGPVTKDEVRKAAGEPKSIQSLADLAKAVQWVTVMANVPEKFVLSPDIMKRLKSERRADVAGQPEVFGIPLEMSKWLPENTWMEVYADKYVVHTPKRTFKVPVVKP